MGFFDKMKDMYSLQRQTKAVKKELKNIHIEAETDGVLILMTGEQEIIKVQINDAAWNDLKNHEFGKKRMEEAFLKAFNKALKKAQEIGNTKMKGVWKKMGIG